MASIFSGKAGRKASIDAERMIGENRELLNAGIDEARDQTGSNYRSARTDYGRALTGLRNQYGATQGYYDQALGYYEPLSQQANAGMTMYGNATGINGAAGNAAARNAFQAGPGYEWQVNQATDAIQRKAGAAGMLASGNMATELQDRAGQMANAEYGSWLDRLNPYLAMSQNVAGAQANIRGAQAGAAQQYGQDQAGVYGGRAATYMGQAGQVNDLLKTRAAGLLDLGSQQVAAHTSGMMAGQQAAGNRFGALMGGLQLAGQAIGGMAGLPVAGGGSLGGNFLSGIFGK